MAVALAGVGAQPRGFGSRAAAPAVSAAPGQRATAAPGGSAARHSLILDTLKGLPPDADVVAVGDHGEMLGEHGELAHGLLLYSGARRVPLLMAGPGARRRAQPRRPQPAAAAGGRRRL